MSVTTVAWSCVEKERMNVVVINNNSYYIVKRRPKASTQKTITFTQMRQKPINARYLNLNPNLNLKIRKTHHPVPTTSTEARTTPT